MADDNDNSNVGDVSIFDPKADALEQIKEHIEPDEVLTIRGHEYINKATAQRLLGTSRRGVEKLVSSGKLRQENSPMPGRKPQCIYLLRKVADIWAVRQRSKLAAVEAGKVSALTVPLGTTSADAFERMLERIFSHQAQAVKASTSAIDLAFIEQIEQLFGRVMIGLGASFTESTAKLIEAQQRSNSKMLNLTRVREDYGDTFAKWARKALDDGTLRNFGTTKRPRFSRYEFEVKAGLCSPSQPPAVSVAYPHIEVSSLRAAS